MASTSNTAIDPNVPKKKKVVKSGVWAHFKLIDDSPENPKSACNYCGTVYRCHSRTFGTSNMSRHLRSCKNYLLTHDATQKKLTFPTKKEAESSSSSSSYFSQKGGRDVIVKMLIKEELPLRLVEADSVKEAFRFFQPSFLMPSRRTVARDIEVLYMKEKTQLKDFLQNSKQRICLTTDCWTSSQTINYMVLTGHFIDSNWTLHKRILNFRQIDDHRGDTIGKMIETCLHEWGIENVYTITVDNASSNNVAISYLMRSLRQWKGVVLNGECLHVRCFAHIINLIVNDGVKEHQPAIKRVRKAVKYVKSSPGRLQQFKNCIQLMKITYTGNVTSDTPTRWNSTFLMLDHAEKYEKTFEQLRETDIQYFLSFGEEGPPNEDDWTTIREFCKLLKVFYDATLICSASLHVTSNLYISEVCKLKLTMNEYAEGDNDLLKTMAKSMQAKFNKYWGDFDKMNALMFVALLLDPRCKRTMLRHCISLLLDATRVDEFQQLIESVLHRLYSEYKGDDGSATTSTQTSEKSSGVTDILFSSLYKSAPDSQVIGSMSEIEEYLNEKVVPYSEDLVILAWWKINCHRYPTLSLIAKDVLVTPISTVALESAFSCGGRVVDSFRTSLLPKTVEALICTQSWLRSKPPSSLEGETIEEYGTIDEEIAASFADLTIETDSLSVNLSEDESLPMIIE